MQSRCDQLRLSWKVRSCEWSELLEREGAAAVKAEKARLLAEAEEEAKQERLEAEARKVEAAEREQIATDYESEWEGIQSENEAQNYSLKQKKRKNKKNA